LARHHGFDAAIGATLEQIDGRYSGAISTPIFNKAEVLHRLIEEHDLTTDGSYAVGDSKSDASMLEIVENPIAFNPDWEFFAIAKDRGWKIVVERKNMVFELMVGGVVGILYSGNKTAMSVYSDFTSVFHLTVSLGGPISFFEYASKTST
jgi:hypothetical protein